MPNIRWHSTLLCPPPPRVVLDVGGGPGRYACWLAVGGYDVHLVDPVPRHVEQALAASAAQPDHLLASAPSAMSVRCPTARAAPMPSPGRTHRRDSRGRVPGYPCLILSYSIDRHTLYDL